MNAKEIQISNYDSLPESVGVLPVALLTANVENGIDNLESGFKTSINVQLNDIRGEFEHIQIEDKVKNLQMDSDLYNFEDVERLRQKPESGVIGNFTEVLGQENSRSSIAEKIDETKEEVLRLAELKLPSKIMLQGIISLLENMKESEENKMIAFLDFLLLKYLLFSLIILPDITGKTKK